MAETSGTLLLSLYRTVCSDSLLGKKYAEKIFVRLLAYPFQFPPGGVLSQKWASRKGDRI